MQYWPTKNHGIIFGFIFVCALLFFGITNHIAKDVALARAEKNKSVYTPPKTEVVVDAVDPVLPEPRKVPVPVKKIFDTSTYLEVTDSCGAHYGGDCLRVRSGPGTDYPVVASLRNGMVLKVSDTVTTGTTTWHKVIFDEWLRYPDRHNGNWYVASDYVTLVEDIGTVTMGTNTPMGTTSKSILVDRSDQMLYAYDGDVLFMTATTSTGLDSTPTPRGVFNIFKKTPSRYMQGPLPNISDDFYDLPGVPWTMYFTEGGAAIHGAYWHDKFGTKHSHGCVNLEPAIAKILYHWAELDVIVTVRD